MKNAWKILFPLLGLCMLLPQVSSAAALLTGLFASFLFGNPWLEQSKRQTHRLLAYSVVGLGAAMDLNVVAKVGLSGVAYTVVGISVTLVLGVTLGKRLGTPRDMSLLISVGTAICGGSAIAAVAPAIGAKSQDVSLSLVTVFLLNAVALLLFPWIGHLLHLGPTQFGLWSALAIHDTSSVVGSAMQFGSESLQVATTVKLTRALWIVPVTFGLGSLRQRERQQSGNATHSIKKPWFILGFLLAAALVTWIPDLRTIGSEIASVARRLLVVTLFLIGANVSWETVKTVGIRPLVLGVVLWGIVGSLTLGAIQWGWIR